MSLAAFELPGRLGRLILSGGEGKEHLRETAEEAWLACLAAPPADAAGLAGLAAQLCLAVFECDPFDAAWAARLLEIEARAPFLDQKVAALAAAAVKYSRAPADLRYFSRLAKVRDYEKIRGYLQSMAQKEPGNTYWLGHQLALCLAEQDFEQAQNLLRLSAPLEFAPLLPKLLADLAYCLGDYSGARELCRQALANLPWPPALALAGQCELRLGRRENAQKLWQRLSNLRPWHVNTLLRLSDSLRGLDRARANLSGKTSILLYTYNKSAELEHTLCSLFESQLSQASQAWKISLLLNGCTDASASVARAWQERFGPERLEIIELAVNVGAAAARNWLLASPETRQSDWIIYLDDDVSLPGDWLASLAAAKNAWPRAGVYGCRVTDYARPQLIQSADLLLDPLPQPGAGLSRRFAHLSPYNQCLDFGQFSYSRPCASVTGCLHMFRAQELLASGDFDLRFSPSQYDDLDHDLRLLLAGKNVFYHGHLGIAHLKKTGKISGEGGRGYGSGFANQFKLHHKYSQAEIARACELAFAAAREDLRTKLENLDLGSKPGD